MLTNKAFELDPSQIQRYHDWITEYVAMLRQEDEDGDPIGTVEFVFTLTSVGRGVIVRIPWAGREIVLEELL